MVKQTLPVEVEHSLDWILKQQGGTLFAGLVPYGVHVALSECTIRRSAQSVDRFWSGIYDDRKQNLVRSDFERKRDELDALAAT